MEDMYQLKQIPSEAKIKKFLRQTIFGSNVYCPRCKSSQVKRSGERFHCRKCRRRFSLTSHTWLSNLKLPLQQLWMVLDYTDTSQTNSVTNRLVGSNG